MSANVDDDAALGRDALEGTLGLGPQSQRCELHHVTCQALAPARACSGMPRGADQGEVLDAGEHVAVGDGAERAVARRQHGVGYPRHPVVALAPRHEVGDGGRPPAGRGGTPRESTPGVRRHGAVVSDELTDGSDWIEPGEPAQVDGCLGVPGAGQHSPARARNGTTCPGRG